jgi:molybdate transport system substrate-binding protein
LETVSDRLVSYSIALALAALAGCARPAATAPITVSAAASLQPALTMIVEKYNKGQVQTNFGGSGSLARQIESGAPVDVFVSAGAQPMDALASKGLLLPGTRRDLLRNSVILVASNPVVASFESLADPRVRHIAIGNPTSVPAGEYGREVLAALGLWDRVQPKLILDADVTQVLRHVATGNADAGIVYATDAARERNIRTVCAAPPGSHQAVVYPVAVLKSTRNEAAARAFADFLAGPEARGVFQRYAFTVAAP